MSRMNVCDVSWADMARLATAAIKVQDIYAPLKLVPDPADGRCKTLGLQQKNMRATFFYAVQRDWQLQSTHPP